ncbi:MAG TPA: hypothetical protein ENJ09_09500 [Planctomycetes bacterium]|nr:hypothetical protein [Planctomycetota bacterium]
MKTLLTLLFLAVPATAQFDVDISIDTRAKVFRVHESFANPSGEDVDLWIARWTPGAYHPADFGRFAKDFTATDGAGHALDVERVDDSHLRIHANGARDLRVDYVAESISSGVLSHGTIIDVESNRIRDDYAYVTPVSLVAFVPGRLDEPYSVSFEVPDGWKTATVLEADDEGRYSAPSFYRLEDSPVFFAPDLTTVETEAGGRPLEVSVHGLPAGEVDDVVDGCKRIVEAAASMMGGLPYDRYEFLLSYTSNGGGSGLEHSFSTLILMTQGMPLDAQWGIIAHEFFHLWCAERVHVEGIRHPDYTKSFSSKTLWVNESVTEYLSRHVLLRAGLIDREGFFASFQSPLRMASFATDIPSATKASLLAENWESGQDLMVWSMRMYMLQPLTMLALDLEMRRVSGGKRGLVDFVKTAMKEYDAKGRGFPEDSVQEILERVAGGDLCRIYARSIEGTDPPDLASALGVIGYELDGDEFRPLSDPTPEQLAARADFFGS